jgi:hypothetical protein
MGTTHLQTMYFLITFRPTFSPKAAVVARPLTHQAWLPEIRIDFEMLPFVVSANVKMFR